MPLTTAAVGLTTRAFEHEVDARWTMAYSASLDDVAACYLDTSRSDGVVAHPLFAICPEWPVALAARDLLRERGLTDDELRRAVHATHDTHIGRLIRPGDRLSTTSTVLTVEARRPGAFVTECFDTRDQHDELVCRTFHGMLLRGVAVTGEQETTVGAGDIAVPAWPLAADAALAAVDEYPLAVSAGLAHTYSECARIWNPIHTDRAVALAAGLPDIILHGSATLALAISALVQSHANGEPARVRRVSCQFRGMVPMPAALTLRVGAGGADGTLPFEVVAADGQPVLRHAAIVLAA